MRINTSKTTRLNGPLRLVLILSAILISWITVPVYSQQPDVLETVPHVAEEINVSSTVYYVYENGEFKESILSKAPELIGGKELMETLIKLNMRYPDVAKERKIGGTVLISVVIDAQGKMEDAFVHEGIGGGCNDEALRAVKLMDKVGFEPGEIEGRPVTVKFDIPITFLPK